MKAGGDTVGRAGRVPVKPSVRKVGRKVAGMKAMARRVVNKIIKALIHYRKVEARFVQVAHNPSKYHRSASVSSAGNGIKAVTLDLSKIPRSRRGKYMRIAKRLSRTYGFAFRGNKFTYYVKGKSMAPQKRLLGGPGFKAVAGPARFQAVYNKLSSGVRDAFKKLFPKLKGKIIFSMRAGLKMAGNNPNKLIVLMRAAGYRLMTHREIRQVESSAKTWDVAIDGLPHPQALLNYIKVNGGLWIKE